MLSSPSFPYYGGMWRIGSIRIVVALFLMARAGLPDHLNRNNTSKPALLPGFEKVGLAATPRKVAVRLESQLKSSHGNFEEIQKFLKHPAPWSCHEDGPHNLYLQAVKAFRGLPPEQKTLYADAYEALAQNQLTIAKEAQNVSALMSIAQAFRFTKAGEKAARLLLTMAWERNQAFAAASLFAGWFQDHQEELSECRKEQLKAVAEGLSAFCAEGWQEKIAPIEALVKKCPEWRKIEGKFYPISSDPTLDHWREKNDDELETFQSKLFRDLLRFAVTYQDHSALFLKKLRTKYPDASKLNFCELIDSRYAKKEVFESLHADHILKLNNKVNELRYFALKEFSPSMALVALHKSYTASNPFILKGPFNLFHLTTFPLGSILAWLDSKDPELKAAAWDKLHSSVDREFLTNEEMDIVNSRMKHYLSSSADPYILERTLDLWSSEFRHRTENKDFDDTILRFLSHSDARVRKQAIMSLHEKFYGSLVTSPLSKRLLEIFLTDEDPEARSKAKEAAKVKGFLHFEMLTRFTDSKGRKVEDWPGKISLEEASEEIPGLLEKALGEKLPSNRSHTEYMWMLIHYGSKAKMAIPKIQDLIASEKRIDVRTSAQTALDRIYGK